MRHENAHVRAVPQHSPQSFELTGRPLIRPPGYEGFRQTSRLSAVTEDSPREFGHAGPFHGGEEGPRLLCPLLVVWTARDSICDRCLNGICPQVTRGHGKCRQGHNISDEVVLMVIPLIHSFCRFLKTKRK